MGTACLNGLLSLSSLTTSAIFVPNCDDGKCLQVNGLALTERYPPPQQKDHLLLGILIHIRKLILCVWWSKEGDIYYELLPRDVTTTDAEVIANNFHAKKVLYY